MNFLAHALLAGETPALIVGGVAGDWVKGVLPGALPADLAQGVALHRAIDVFAETHPAFCASRARMSLARRRYAGVLVDIFYDHLLARDWVDHGAGSLDDYTAGIYAALQRYRGILPAPAEAVANRMQANDWLASYRDVAAVGRAIDLMAVHRLRQPNALVGGIEEFLADAPGFAADFSRFLPDAQAFAESWRAARVR